MGTSSMYNGMNGNPLLPKDFNPDSDNPEDKDREGDDNSKKSDSPKTNPNKNWKDAKTSMSKYASGRSTNFKGAISQYVKAHGGSKSAARTAKSGLRTTTALGSFFRGVSSDGIREVLTKKGIDLEGKSAQDIFHDIINLIAPIPVSREDSIARKALIETMEILYDSFDEEDKDIEILNNVDGNTLNRIIPLYIEQYIYERLINDLGSRIETNSSSSSDAVKKEKEIKDYINAQIEVSLEDKDFSQFDFDNRGSLTKIKKIYTDCYNVIESSL